MQKNEAGANEQRSAARLLVLHLRCAEDLLLANAGDVTCSRRLFGFGRVKFANVIQFIA